MSCCVTADVSSSNTKMGTHLVRITDNSNTFTSKIDYGSLKTISGSILDELCHQDFRFFCSKLHLLKLKPNTYPFSLAKCPWNTKRNISSDFLKGRTNHNQFSSIFTRYKGKTSSVAKDT